MRVVGSKPRSSKSFFFFLLLGRYKMPFIVTDGFLRGSKTFNAKLISTINCQIHGIQN